MKGIKPLEHSLSVFTSSPTSNSLRPNDIFMDRRYFDDLKPEMLMLENLDTCLKVSVIFATEIYIWSIFNLISITSSVYSITVWKYVTESKSISISLMWLLIIISAFYNVIEVGLFAKDFHMNSPIGKLSRLAFVTVWLFI